MLNLDQRLTMTSICIGPVVFEWDNKKNVQNRAKYHVNFEEAVTIFFNLPLKVVFDPDHSENEDRYIAIGISIKSRTLIVVHCESETGKLVRIISARKATKYEKTGLLGG